MDLAEFRHMTFHAGPVRTAGRWMLYTIIPISPVNDDHIELRPPYLTSVERPEDGTLVFTPAVPATCVCDCPDDERW